MEPSDAGKSESEHERWSDLIRARLDAADSMLDGGHLAEALPLYDEVISDASDDPDDDIEVFLAHALGNKARTLAELGRWGEALATHAEMRRLFSASRVPEIRQEVAASLEGKADVLMDVGLYGPALDTIGRLQEEFAGDPNPQTRELVADSLLAQARILTYLERDADAQAAIDAYCDRYWDEGSPERHVSVLEIKGTICLEAGRAEEALSLYDSALSIPVGDAIDAPVLALTKHQRAKALEQLGRVDEARSGFEAVLREYAGDTRASVKEIVRRTEAALSTLDR